MEAFKINFFEKEHGVSFPFYESLPPDRCKNIKNKIVSKLNLQIQDLGSGFFPLLKYYDFANATENFSLKDILHDLAIVPNDEVYLDWSNFDDIDLIGADNLDKFFNDIWYPVADDIKIFDESLNWIICIRHDGAVYYLKPVVAITNK